MRRLGKAWRWGWVLGFAFLCVYIAFDVLDLDGSQLQLRFGAAITTATTTGESDRALRANIPLPPVRQPASALAGVSGLPLQPALTRQSPLRSRRLLPRRQPAHLGSRAPGQSTEPA